MTHAQDNQMRRSWVRNAEAWVRTVRGGEIESRRVATDEAILAAVLQLAPTRALDLGCGEGWLAWRLAEHDIEVIGVDASPPLVEAARARGGGTFLVRTYAEIADSPQSLGTDFDVFVCNFSLLEEDLAPILRSIRSILIPTGALLIQTVHPWAARGEHPYRDGWRTETFAGFGEGFTEPMPWYFRTLSSWAELLRASGYRISSLREPQHPESGEPLSLLLNATPEQR